MRRVAQSRAQSRSYGSQAVAVRHAAQQQRIAATVRHARATGGPVGRSISGDAQKRETPSQRAAIDRGVREARLDYLRQQRRSNAPSFADLLRLATGARQTRVTGRGGRSRPTGAIAAPGVYGAPVVAPVSRSVGRRFASDLGLLGAAPFVGGYELGAGAYEAVRHGNTSRLQRLGAGIAHGVAEEVRHPVRYARQHPLLAGLDLAGGIGAVGRVGGAVARGVGSSAEAAGARGALARAGSTVRPPLALVDDPASPLVERSYSKDLTRKAAQVAADRQRAPLRDAQGNVVRVRQRGRMVPVLRGSVGGRERLARKRGDVVASRANSVERLVREQAGREFRVRGVQGRRAKDLVSMVVEGTITSAKHFRDDLVAHRDRLATVLDRHAQGEPIFRHRGELQAARARLATVERALEDPRVTRQAARIVSTGESIGRRLNATERQAIDAGLLHPVRAARAKLVPAAVEHMGARHFTAEELRSIEGASARELKHGAIRKPDGTFLANRDVEELLRSRGRDPESVAYLPHRLDVRGRRAYHTQFRPGQRPTLDKPESRTGAAYARGATEASRGLVTEHAVRQATQLAKAQQIDRLVREHGLKRPGGQHFTAQQALEAVDRIEKDTGERLTPVRAFGARLKGETLARVRDELQGPREMESLHERLLNDRIVTEADKASRARNVVLMPAELVGRLQEHLRPAGSIERFFQFLNRPFRMAVLPQPRWLAGNFIEPFLVRLPGKGAGVNVPGLAVDMLATRRVLRAMDRGSAEERAAARELRAHQEGGLFVGGRGATVRRTAQEAFPERLRRPYGRMVSRLPVVGQMGEMLRTAGHWAVQPLEVFFRLNRAIEATAQRQALGKSIREDMQAFTGSWLETIRLGERAVADAKRGLVGTATQERFVQAQHELLGKYEGYSPTMRALIQGPAPFLPWALNAARFVYWTLPMHRTTQTALLLRTEQVVDREWEDQHRNVPPGGLRLAIPTKSGGWIDAARYTPWGLTGPIAKGENLRSVKQEFTPQLGGAENALEGRDPFGRDLRVKPSRAHPDGRPSTGQLVAIAVNQLAESTVPYLSTARRLREHGATPYGDSSVVSPRTKPGTSHGMSAARRTFDPFRPTYLGTGRSAPVALRRGPRTVDDRIDAALDRLDAAGAADDEQQRRISRALDALGIR